LTNVGQNLDSMSVAKQMKGRRKKVKRFFMMEILKM